MSDESRHVLALGVALLGALILVVVAGTSDAAGTATLTFVVGLWLVWLVRHPSIGSTVSNALGGAQ